MVPDGSVSKSSVRTSPTETGSSVVERSTDSGHIVASDEKTVISKRPLNPPPAPLLPVKPADVGLSLVGQTLGHFKLEEFVGGGGMGAVFRAVDGTLGRTVAVKVVSNQNADEDMLRRFRNEAQSAARLDHPNIARVYYVGEEKGWSYIVFEFIEGVNIRDLVEQRGPLPVDETIRYTLQIADALDHAAARDVVHRDIKPSNILVMPDGRAKLVDMGLARLHQVDAPSQDLTETGVTLGTFDYISPEQAKDPRSADVRSDLYSLGCTVYYMLTGSPPFPEGTVLQKLLSHSSDPAPDPRDLRPELDDDLTNIALKLMAKLPQQRFQSPAELIDRLLILSDRLGLPLERRYGFAPLAPASDWRALIVRHVPWVLPSLLLVGTVLGLEAVAPGSRSISPEAIRPFQSSVTSPRVVLEDGLPVVPSADHSPAETTPEPIRRSPAPSPDPDSPPAARSEVLGSGSNTAANGTTSSPAATEVPPASRSPDSPSVAAATPAASEPAPDPERPSGPMNTVTSDPVVSPGPATASPQRVESPADAAAETPSNVLLVSSDVADVGKPNNAGTLSACFQKLASSPQVDTIELRFRQRIEAPLTLAPRSQDSELTIRSGPNATPLIIFRPPTGEVHDRNLFKIIGGKVNFVGVHFRVELGSQSSEDWSLFHLKDTDRVTFTNCTFTIRNDKGVVATFFSVDAPAPSKMMMPSDMPEVATGPAIELKSCVARGDANVVRAVNGLPFSLNWSQGFLATGRTAVVARGIRENSNLLIWLRFANVTGSLGAGLCQVEMDSSSPVMPDLRIETTSCVWLQLDPDVPLVEHLNVDNIEHLTKNLYRWGGEQNLYPATKVLWRIQSRTGEVVNYRFRDAFGRWNTEGSVYKGVRWQRSLPAEGRATFTYSFRDFLLVPELANMAGFNESFLPEPREPDPEATAPPRTNGSRTVDTPL